jgi:hypothetical protein
MKLRSCYVIARHGVRFPLNVSPNSLCWPQYEKFGERYAGLLTSQGDQQHRELARALIKQYPVLFSMAEARLKSTGNTTGLRIKTTDKQRTIFSAMAFTESLTTQPKILSSDEHGNEAESLSSPMADRQLRGVVPIAIVNIKRPANTEHGSLASVLDLYDKYKEAAYEKHRSEVSIRLKFPSLAEKLYRVTGLSGFSVHAKLTKEMSAVFAASTQIEIERELHMPVLANTSGEQMTDTEIATLFKHRELAYHLRYGEDTAIATHTVGYIKVKHFVDDILRWVQEATDSSSTEYPYFQYFAAHDSTIMAMFSLLGFTNFAFPHFAASIIFELWQDTGSTNFFTRFRYLPYSATPSDSQFVDNGYRLPGLGKTVSMSSSSFKSNSDLDELDKLVSVLKFCPLCKYIDHKSTHQMEKAVRSIFNMDPTTFNVSCSSCSSATGTKVCDVQRTCELCDRPAIYSCGHCGNAYYCCIDHVTVDWIQHRISCMKHSM